jgi:hypothetical protein
MKNLDNIVSAINHLRDDIKAEAIVADIIENGVSTDDIVTIPDGLFKRRFNPDISKAEVKKLDNDQKVLEIHITRDGIYDALPTGLFHEQPTESVVRGKDMAGESKKQRLIEKVARKFFLPFENEIFLKHIDLELEERKILSRWSENLFDDIFSGFWKLDGSLPQKFLSRLIILLPLAHKITGNLEMTARTLEIIIEEKVKVSLIQSDQLNEEKGQANVDDPGTLGSSYLGTDFVCDHKKDTTQAILEFEIGPLEQSTVEDYLEDGQVFRFLDCFFGYFIPVEMDQTIKVTVNQEEYGLTLDPAVNPILGYNSAI